MRLRIAFTIGLAAAGAAFASKIDKVQPENLNLLGDTFRRSTFVCMAQPSKNQADPCSTHADEGCIKLTRLAPGEHYLPFRDTEDRRHRWCEASEQDVPFVTPGFIALAAAVESQSQTPELPSFVLVGAGLMLFRMRLRRTR